MRENDGGRNRSVEGDRWGKGMGIREKGVEAERNEGYRRNEMSQRDTERESQGERERGRETERERGRARETEQECARERDTQVYHNTQN